MHKSRIGALTLAVLIAGCGHSTSDGKVQAQREKKEIGCVDMAGDANGNGTMTKGTMLRVAGWAADTATAAPVQNVTVFVDGNSVGTATLGAPRPDVANSLGRSDYTNSGWSFLMSTSSLSVGQHTVTAAAAGP